MLNTKMIEELIRVKGLDIATKVIVMATIQFTTKVKHKNKDTLAGTGNAKIIKKFNRIYPSMDITECNCIIELIRTYQNYVMDSRLYGLDQLGLELVTEIPDPELVTKSCTYWVTKYS